MRRLVAAATLTLFLAAPAAPAAAAVLSLPATDDPAQESGDAQEEGGRQAEDQDSSEVSEDEGLEIKNNTGPMAIAVVGIAACTGVIAALGLKKPPSRSH